MPSINAFKSKIVLESGQTRDALA